MSYVEGYISIKKYQLIAYKDDISIKKYQLIEYKDSLLSWKPPPKGTVKLNFDGALF